MRIALVSDTHLAARAVEFAANFRAAARWIDGQGFDAVVHLGDITADGAGDPGEFAEAQAILAACRTPMRFLPGNHDVGDNPPAPGRSSGESPADAARLSAYRDRFGADRWSLDAGGWRLIGLNAQLFGTGLEEEESQFSWLAGQAEGPLVLFLHKPLFRDGPGEDEPHARYVPAAARARLLALLGPKGLRLVVSGHAHQRRRLSVDGVDHVWLPSAGFVIPDHVQEAIGAKEVGIAALELDGRELRLTFERPEGMRDLNLLDHPHVYPKVAAMARPPAATLP